MPAYKDSNTGKWSARFYYEANDGSRKQKRKRGFERKKDAELYEAEFLIKIEGNPEITFSSLAKEYLKDMKHRIRKSTLKVKKNIFNTHLIPYFGEKNISDIKTRHIREWQNSMLERELKATYLRRLNTELNSVLNYAVKYHGLKKNPASEVKKIGLRETHNFSFWTAEEFNIFIQYFNSNSPRDIYYRTIFILLFYTGLRIGEVLALTLDDIDFSKGTIRINKTYQRINGEDFIGNPKTVSSNRIVAIPEFVINQLQQFLDILYNPDKDTRLFIKNREAIAKMMKQAARAQNVKIIRVHDLRHSHASHLIELGFNPLIIQERLGHKNVEITLNTYSHLYPHKQQEVANQLNNLLSPN